MPAGCLVVASPLEHHPLDGPDTMPCGVRVGLEGRIGRSPGRLARAVGILCGAPIARDDSGRVTLLRRDSRAQAAAPAVPAVAVRKRAGVSAGHSVSKVAMSAETYDPNRRKDGVRRMNPSARDTAPSRSPRANAPTGTRIRDNRRNHLLRRSG